MKETKKSVEQVQKKRTARDYHYSVGRHKESVARVRLYQEVKEGLTWGEHAVSKERILVNLMPIDKYFPGDVAKANYEAPLKLVNSVNKFAFSVKVAGGGKKGQLVAVVKGIARVVAGEDIDKYRLILKKAGLLTRDP